MRLDHLLSKELLDTLGCPRAITQAHVLWWFAHGWNIDLGSGSHDPVVSTVAALWSTSPGKQLERHPLHARCWVLRDRAPHFGVGSDLWTMAQCFFMKSVAAVFGPVSSVSFREAVERVPPVF